MDYKSLGETPVNNILKGKPQGWIQFKGTDLCMDVRCKCGELTHIDGDFVYFVKCTKCGTVYELNGHIELLEWTPESLDPDRTVHETSD